MPERQQNPSYSEKYTKQLNIDFSITSILPGGRKPDIIIENKKVYNRHHGGI